MAAERQSVEERPGACQRGSTMRLSTTAPEITLTVAKLAASMSSCRKASLHNKELAEKASIATTVSNMVLAEIELEFPEGITATLISIFACIHRTVCIYPTQFNPAGTQDNWFLGFLAILGRSVPLPYKIQKGLYLSV